MSESSEIPQPETPETVTRNFVNSSKRAARHLAIQVPVQIGMILASAVILEKAVVDLDPRLFLPTSTAATTAAFLGSGLYKKL